MSRFTSTKAQVWSLDIIIAMIVFVAALILFYQQSINLLDERVQQREDILLDAQIISSYLVSSGYPQNWTVSNVTIIGLTDGKMRLQESKVLQFQSLITTNYSVSKKLLSTNHHYLITFEDKNNNSVSVSGITQLGNNYTAAKPQQLIKVVRFVNYNSSIIRMGVTVW